MARSADNFATGPEGAAPENAAGLETPDAEGLPALSPAPSHPFAGEGAQAWGKTLAGGQKSTWAIQTGVHGGTRLPQSGL